MHSAYSLPPGYAYQIHVDDDDVTLRMAVVDRAGETVLTVPVVGEDGFKIIHHVVRANPEWLSEHTAAFLVWRLDESPLAHSVRRP